MLLSTGGENDVWPEGFALIDFETTTDTLQAGLLMDEHFVVRCRHDLGHFQLPAGAWEFAQEWMMAHRFGEASPYVEDGLGSEGDWCEVAAGR